MAFFVGSSAQLAMASTAAEHLVLINEVITKRLNGDAFESYRTSQRQFIGTPIEKLFDLRDRLQREVNGDGAGTFRLAAPFE